MRRGMFDMLLIVVGICLLPAGLWAQTDANAPWSVDDHLAPHPLVIGKTAYFLYDQQDDSQWEPTNWTSLELMGEIEVLDPNGLIGLCTCPIDVVILDEAGDRVYLQEISSPDVWSYEPVNYKRNSSYPSGETIWEIEPYEFSIEITGTSMTYPSMLSRVEWTMLALISDTVEVVQLPFAPSDDWVELAPGLEVLIEQTLVEDNQYEYHSTVILDPNRISYPDRRRPGIDDEDGLQGHTWPTTGHPETIVFEIDFLDAEGNSLQEHGDSVRSSGEGRSIDYDEEGRTIMSHILYGSGSGCSEIAFIGYTIVSEFHFQGLEMALENLPVPALCP